tara:strand:+ start:211 stop:576 length:366 start_codon:yes stop_codon:yes gene_type:complete
MNIVASNNYIDLVLYGKIKDDILNLYPNLGDYHQKCIVDERYKKYGGGFKNDSQIATMKKYVDNLENMKKDPMFKSYSSIDLIQKHGRKKVVALKICKEIDEKGEIDWEKGIFNKSREFLD